MGINLKESESIMLLRDLKVFIDLKIKYTRSSVVLILNSFQIFVAWSYFLLQLYFRIYLFMYKFLKICSLTHNSRFVHSLNVDFNSILSVQKLLLKRKKYFFSKLCSLWYIYNLNTLIVIFLPFIFLKYKDTI